jgi:DNA-binding response OmpR family regulator
MGNQSVRGPGDLGGKRVLVVEDDPAARRVLVQALLEAGCNAIEAADGLAALEAVGRAAPDLVLLDLGLPKLGGEHVLERLRRTSDVPVIIVSARRDEDSRVEMLNLGADDYLVKPFTLRELLARVRSIVRRSEGEVVTTVSIGDVVIDRAAKSASRDGERVPLTPLEFEVLACLTRNRGRIVPRAELERSIHPGGPASGTVPAEPHEEVSNVLDVIVMRLRRKLGNDLITTRRGQGFIVDG